MEWKNGNRGLTRGNKGDNMELEKEETTMYNLSTIMKKAWEMFRNSTLTFSECLKISWRNAKEILKSILDNEIKEPVHTWYGWFLMGKQVKHGSECLFQVLVEDLKTKSGYRTLSFFGESQVEIQPE